MPYGPASGFLQSQAKRMGALAESREPQGYPSTHWSLIFQATLPEQQAGEGALNRLLARYYAPLLAHVEFRFRLPREAAEDLLQGFIFRNVLARQCLARRTGPAAVSVPSC